VSNFLESLVLSVSQLLVIMLGGAFGAAARFVVSTKITEKLGNSFPYGTLTVNMIGSFVMGLLAIILVERLQLDPLYRLGIFVGFLGAFTTFSTFSMETLNLFNEGMPMRALLNMFSSVLLSVLAIWLGVLIGKAVS
jgi:CrcB protein